MVGGKYFLLFNLGDMLKYIIILYGVIRNWLN